MGTVKSLIELRLLKSELKRQLRRQEDQIRMQSADLLKALSILFAAVSLQLLVRRMFKKRKKKTKASLKA